VFATRSQEPSFLLGVSREEVKLNYSFTADILPLTLTRKTLEEGDEKRAKQASSNLIQLGYSSHGQKI
jgi:hypothetical protein